MMRWWIVIALAGVAIMIGGAYALFRTPVEVKVVTEGSVEELHRAWQEIFTQEEPEDAYARFIEAGSQLDYNSVHILAHVVGEILYERLGPDGIGICTQDFSFGCYHGLAGLALEREGLGIVTALADACDQPGLGFFPGCTHGIGHGILAHIGNSELASALQACSDMQGDEPIGGCFGGVFMEYNYNTMQSDDGVELRAYEAARSYEPCTTVSERFRAACYYELPSWWVASFAAFSGEAEQEHFDEAGALCARIEDRVSKSLCFRGIGNIIGPQSGYDFEIMSRWCSPMPDADADELCLHEASNHLLQSDRGRFELEARCRSGSMPFTDLCGNPAKKP